MKFLTFALFCLLCSFKLLSQSKYPYDLYIDGYGFLGLSNEVNLNDTVRKVHSSKVYFRFVLFDPRGKSYFEIYRDNKLISKGYYENSLDTLKSYTTALPIGGKHSKIEVVKYFQPLKQGLWVERINGKYVKRKYTMGILENPE